MHWPVLTLTHFATILVKSVILLSHHRFVCQTYSNKVTTPTDQPKCYPHMLRRSSARTQPLEYARTKGNLLMEVKSQAKSSV